MADQPPLSWAPRLPQALIQRLYRLDALGIVDEELIDEVGWGLRARCQSFIEAVWAARGQLHCPACQNLIHYAVAPEIILLCDRCGWQAAWKDVFKTIQHKQLSGAEPVLRLFDEFVQGFPAAGTPQHKMLLIDGLLHGFHLYLNGSPTRAVAVNLIEGRYHEVVEFLDRLSYGPGSTPGLQQTHQDWQKSIDDTARAWGMRG